MLGADSHSVAV